MAWLSLSTRRSVRDARTWLSDEAGELRDEVSADLREVGSEIRQELQSGLDEAKDAWRELSLTWRRE